jgi:hypothetical protein
VAADFIRQAKSARSGDIPIAVFTAIRDQRLGARVRILEHLHFGVRCLAFDVRCSTFNDIPIAVQ